MKAMRFVLVAIVAAAAGIFTWRKVGEKQLRDDLWREAEEHTHR